MGMSVILVIILVVIAAAVAIYNGLIQKRVAVKNAWSQIDVQLKRRHDLIPNLVETVKGYVKHEQGTLESVIKARQNVVQLPENTSVAALAESENMLTGALRQLFALSESYPDLKANQNFLNLQEEIASTENKISFARQHYNDSVAVYNTAIQQVPANMVAKYGDFPMKEFFELSIEETAAIQEPPKVSF